MSKCTETSRLDKICSELSLKTKDGSITLQDIASAMEEFQSDQEALWQIAFASTPDETDSHEDKNLKK